MCGERHKHVSGAELPGREAVMDMVPSGLWLDWEALSPGLGSLCSGARGKPLKALSKSDS